MIKPEHNISLWPLELYPIKQMYLVLAIFEIIIGKT